MQCPTCGNTLTPDAHFCPRCGTQLTAPPPPPAAPYPYPPALFPYTRVARHLQILGILWLVYAVFRTLTKLAAMLFLQGIFHGHSNWGADWTPFGHMTILTFWPIIAISAIVGLILSLLTGYALLTRQPWGRIFAIVIACLNLIHPITGTALGIYTLWVLAPAASGVEYEALIATQRQPSQP